MPGRERNQVREAFQGDGIAVSHEFGDSFSQGNNACQVGIYSKLTIMPKPDG